MWRAVENNSSAPSHYRFVIRMQVISVKFPAYFFFPKNVMIADTTAWISTL